MSELLAQFTDRVLWGDNTKATDRTEAVRALAKFAVGKEARAFALGLEPEAAKLCIEALDYASCDPHTPFHYLIWSFQGVAGHNLKTAEMVAFFLTLRKLAERHGILPDWVMIRERFEVSAEVLAFGGFGDIRSGMYMGRHIAVKTAKLAQRDKFDKARKVSINFSHPGRGLNQSYPAILPGSHPLERAFPSEHIETCRGLGGHGEERVRHRVRVDGPRDHHGVH